MMKFIAKTLVREIGTRLAAHLADKLLPPVPPGPRRSWRN
jgi:hypothetical protein